ncbi:hypothetical protein J572_2639 [Acinetobacter baumannii 1499986]|uniref:Uncharacterized protein n=1 Tax=Acinetobacter baumannii 1499986 TaxID=1310673 RepID=A0A836LZX6_ACIBA|nr:hypothetical protein J572_2639 [Acinetobacter baumannii 1499986]
MIASKTPIKKHLKSAFLYMDALITRQNNVLQSGHHYQ